MKITINPVVEKLLLVIIGAVVGVLPVMVSNTMQARSQSQQMTFDRKLDAIRRYSSACNRRVVLRTRGLSLLRLIRPFIDTPPKEVDAEFIQFAENTFREIAAFNSDSASAQVEYQAEVDFANALFATQIPSDPAAVPVPLPTTLREARKLMDASMTEGDQSIPKLTSECAANTKMLISRLSK